MSASWRYSVARALEALQDGNTDEATAFLEAVLSVPKRRGVRCPECGLCFSFAGEVDHHLRFVHGKEGS